MSKNLTLFTKEQARKELRKRILLELLRRDPVLHAQTIRELLLDSLHAKQRAVIADIEAGHRFLALCTSRRAGKTVTIATQIVLSLLTAGHNQSVLFVASSLWKGRDLIWAELTRLIAEYHLPWEAKEHLGSITTPAGGKFSILGLSTKGKAEAPRGADVIAAFVDEVQDSTHLLAPLLTAISPALVGRGGILVLSGTPGHQPVGTWHDIAELGRHGFRRHHFTILDNTKLQRDPQLILQEELERNHWTKDTPEYQREYLGLWVPDDSTMVFSFDSERDSILELPPTYSSRWTHCMAIDLGYNDHSAWCVVALDQQTGQKIVLHSESHPKLFEDQAVEITKKLVREYSLTRVVCDPAAGGLQFYQAFNNHHGKALGLAIRGANKINKVGRVALANSELRAGRLKLLRPSADVLATELQTLRYRSKEACEFLTSSIIRDDCTDTLMYALAELAPLTPNPTKLEPKPTDHLSALFDQRTTRTSIRDDLF